MYRSSGIIPEKVPKFKNFLNKNPYSSFHNKNKIKLHKKQ